MEILAESALAWDSYVSSDGWLVRVDTDGMGGLVEVRERYVGLPADIDPVRLYGRLGTTPHPAVHPVIFDAFDLACWVARKHMDRPSYLPETAIGTNGYNLCSLCVGKVIKDDRTKGVLADQLRRWSIRKPPMWRGAW